MRRCLYITKDLPARLDSGGRLRTWHMLRSFAAAFDEVTLLGFGAAPADLPGNVRCIPVRQRTSPLHLGRCGFSAVATRWFHPALAAAARAADAGTHVHVDFSTLACNVPASRPLDSLDLHNVEAMLFRRRMRDAPRAVAVAARVYVLLMDEV